MVTKLLEVELTSIHVEGDRYRVRFTMKKDRGQIADFILNAPPELKFGDYTLVAVPITEGGAPATPT